MHQIPHKVEFYITNVCNLTCEDCNRFNNHEFKGWQKWSDYRDTYAEWSKKVKLKAITIMGGEPFLNPTLPDWVQGLNQLFGIEVQILTNGTRFQFQQNLYPTLLYRSRSNYACNHIGVSLHIPSEFEALDADIRAFLKGPIIVKPNGDELWQSDCYYCDANGVVVNVYLQNKFGSSAIQLNQAGQHTLYNSDPVVAHSVCSFAQSKCYHFIRGQLYKCGPVALLPEFDTQHPFLLTDSDKELLNSYKPLTTDNFDRYHEEFFDNIDNPIPQCKFCPEHCNQKTIFPIRKGSK
jgi:hypothetical protein